LAEVYEAQRKFPDAERLHHHIIHVLRSRLLSRIPTSAQRLDLSSAKENFVMGSLMPKGRLIEAEGLLDEILSVRELELGDMHWSTLGSTLYLAIVWLKQGYFEKAETSLDDVLTSLRMTVGASHRLTLEAMTALAQVYRLKGRRNKALIFEQEVVRRVQDSPVPTVIAI
jgi:hypothetical protein